MTSSNDPVDSAANDRSSGDPIDTRLVRKLATILKDTDLTEIEVERGDLRIRVAREAPQPAPLIAPMAAVPAAVAAAPAASPGAGAPAAAVAADAPPAIQGELVKSPMVGTVYLSSQPGAASFVKVGDKVTEGQTLMIIEAMKTMNPIPSPRAGVVVQVVAEDGQPVEFGEGLLVLQ
jgi:acetyl-CoA carboxylase biotin carboxyl carrier protein